MPPATSKPRSHFAIPGNLPNHAGDARKRQRAEPGTEGGRRARWRAASRSAGRALHRRSRISDYWRPCAATPFPSPSRCSPRTEVNTLGGSRIPSPAGPSPHIRPGEVGRYKANMAAGIGPPPQGGPGGPGRSTQVRAGGTFAFGLARAGVPALPPYCRAEICGHGHGGRGGGLSQPKGSSGWGVKKTIPLSRKTSTISFFMSALLPSGVLLQSRLANRYLSGTRSSRQAACPATASTQNSRAGWRTRAAGRRPRCAASPGAAGPFFRPP